jgi:hypothetical protein
MFVFGLWHLFPNYLSHRLVSCNSSLSYPQLPILRPFGLYDLHSVLIARFKWEICKPPGQH